MRLTAVLFDLDGTLTESGEGIMNAARAGLSAVGREAGDSKMLKKLIGPPLSEGFSQIYGLGSEELPNAIRAFRAYYESKGIFENKLYPGAAELLQTLEVSGKKLYLASSKPEFQAKRVLAHFSLDTFFSGVAGGDDSRDGGDKEKIMARLISAYAIDVRSAVMVGDRAYDVRAARSMGMPSIGVDYGYGSRRELEEAGASYIVSSIHSLQELLMRGLNE